MGERSLTPQEVADLLQIKKNTVYELVKRGELKAYRVGRKLRVEETAVNEYKAGMMEHQMPQKTFAPISTPFLPNRGELIICGQDAFLDVLSQRLENHPQGAKCLRHYIGSYNAIYELYNDRAQVATAHLWDGDTDTYNLPYMKGMLPGIPFVLIRLVSRIQGFYVQKGNPQGIQSWEDLKRNDIILANREKGSGTRVLLDERLRLLQIRSHHLQGYDQVFTSHLSVASAVAQGRADFGLGNEKAALQTPTIDFIPMQEEWYDMVMKKEDFEQDACQTIVSILNTLDFKREIEAMGGYNTGDMGKILHA